jgi:hypothetical protein
MKKVRSSKGSEIDRRKSITKLALATKFGTMKIEDFV